MVWELRGKEKKKRKEEEEEREQVTLMGRPRSSGRLLASNLGSTAGI